MFKQVVKEILSSFVILALCWLVTFIVKNQSTQQIYFYLTCVAAVFYLIIELIRKALVAKTKDINEHKIKLIRVKMKKNQPVTKEEQELIQKYDKYYTPLNMINGKIDEANAKQPLPTFILTIICSLIFWKIFKIDFFIIYLLLDFGTNIVFRKEDLFK